MIEPPRNRYGTRRRALYRVSTIDDTNLPICRYASVDSASAHMCRCVTVRGRVCECVLARIREPVCARRRADAHTRKRTSVRRGCTCVKLHTWVGISDIYGQYFRFSCCYRSPYQFNMSAIKNWIKLYPHLATVSTR